MNKKIFLDMEIHMTKNTAYKPKKIQTNVLEIVENCFINENNGNLNARAEAFNDLKEFLIETSDGLYTIKSQDSKETMHTHHGGINESLEKYIKPSHLIGRECVNILDICSGLGYTAATCIEYLNHPLKDGTLPQISIEMVEISALTLAAGLIIPSPLPSHSIVKRAIEDQLYRTGFLCNRLVEQEIPENININITISDARNLVRNGEDLKLNGVAENFYENNISSFDAILLIAFSPAASPELYSLEFFSGLINLLKDDGLLSSFSNSPAMRYALVKAGFHVGEGPEFGRSGGTLASPSLNIIEKPLCQDDERIIALTDAGVPFRDVTLKSSTTDIVLGRQLEREHLRDISKVASTVRCPIYLGRDMKESRLKRRLMRNLKFLGIDDLNSPEARFLICPQHPECICGNSCQKIENSRDRIFEMEKRLNDMVDHLLNS